MAKDEMDVVSQLRQAVVDRVGKERTDLWLRGGEALCLEGGVLVVGAADEFTMDRIRRNFCGELLAAAEQALGRRPQIHFRLDDAFKRRSGKRRLMDVNQRYLDFGEDGAPERELRGEESPAAAPEPVQRVDLKPRAGRRFARLETFVVAATNRLGHAAALKAVAQPGVASPLYLFGPTGCGKTHLAEGIWSATRRQGKLCIYLTAEQFTTQFLEGLRGGQGLPSFRHKTRNIDLLIIDDVQFLHGKRATLQELLSTVDYFSRERKQIVLAADRPPGELPSLGPELVARLSSGLIADLMPLDAAARRSVLQAQLAERGQRLPDDVLDLLSTELPGDGRRLQGALNRLEAMQEATGRAMNVGFAREALKDLLAGGQKMIRLIDIESVVCDLFGLAPKSLHSEAKIRAVTTPRTLAMYLVCKHTHAGLSEISQHFGLKSHSVVVAAQKKVTAWRDQQTLLNLAAGNCDVEEAVRRVESALRVV